MPANKPRDCEKGSSQQKTTMELFSSLKRSRYLMRIHNLSCKIHANLLRTWPRKQQRSRRSPTIAKATMTCSSGIGVGFSGRPGSGTLGPAAHALRRGNVLGVAKAISEYPLRLPSRVFGTLCFPRDALLKAHDSAEESTTHLARSLEKSQKHVH